MNSTQSSLAYFLDLEPEVEDFRAAVIDGLSENPKWIPPKFFYDAPGSKLFDQICELEEYYVTRTELAIMRQFGSQIGERIGPRARIIEYGCGSSLKIRALLDALIEPSSYVAIDISREHLRATAEEIAVDYPALEVGGVCADFTAKLDLPDDASGGGRVVGFFPGSTIGNQTPDEARAFLQGVRAEVGDSGGLLIGVDLEKDVEILNAAYDDRAGVTAAFNINLLHRMKRELGAVLNVDGFEHVALFNADKKRVEMHLRATSPQTIILDGNSFSFAEGETIHTENSHKYSLDNFAALAEQTGFAVVAAWTDPDELFSVQFLEAK